MHKYKKLTALFISTVAILTASYVKSIGVTLPMQNEPRAFNEIEVIPGGDAIGIKLYTEGVLVVDIAGFETTQGEIFCPAEKAGIMPGDSIIALNGKTVTDNEMFINSINEAGESELVLDMKRGSKAFQVSIIPVRAKDGIFKIGTWIRDSAAGIGTLTFYRADNGHFAALGHGISDSDIGAQYVVRDGSIQNAEITSVVKGEKGIPGELKGIFSPQEEILGNVTCNDFCGIYGKMTGTLEGEKVKVASSREIEEGPAALICTIADGKESYDIEIQKINRVYGSGTKSMIIKVTDQRLISKTGGIVQGMSGSPIIQNNKLVGAVTHVFVNDPTRGYGIFIENMLAEAEKIK